MESYIIILDGPKTIGLDAIRKAIIAAVNAADEQADIYGPALAGYNINIQRKN